jgi:hypothetical protein
MERPAEGPAGPSAETVKRRRAWWIIFGVLVATAGLGVLIGSPRGWFVLPIFVVAPFTILVFDRPATFAGWLAGSVTYGLWLMGTVPFECTLSVDLDQFRVSSAVCPRILLPDLDHVANWPDFMIAYGGGWLVALAIGGATAAIVDRSTRRKQGVTVPPPPPPPPAVTSS